MPIQVSQETFLQAAQQRLGLAFTIQGDFAQVPLSELARVVLGVDLVAPSSLSLSELETKIQSSLASLRTNPLFSQHAPRELEIQVCLALGLSEKELAERLKVKPLTIRSYRGRLILGRPSTEVIKDILDGRVPSKREVNWGGYLGEKRKQILEVLRQAPRGLSTMGIAKEVKGDRENLRGLLRRMVANGDIVRGGTFYQTLWLVSSAELAPREPELELTPKQRRAIIKETDAKIAEINKTHGCEIPANNMGRSLVLDSLGTVRERIADILGLSKVSVSVYCAQLRRMLGKQTIDGLIRSSIPSE